MSIKSVPLVSVDVDAQIRQMLLNKSSVREIRKTLGVSNTKICRIRKEIVTGDTISKASKSARVTSEKRNAPIKSNTTEVYTPEEVEAKRKSVEMLALQAMEDRLNEGDVSIKDATSVLSVVGEKPKAQGDTVVMLINSVGNMAVAARQLLINESKRVASDTITIAADNTDKQDDTMQQDIKPVEVLP